MESIDVVLFTGYYCSYWKEWFRNADCSIKFDTYIADTGLYLWDTFQLYGYRLARYPADLEFICIDFFSMIANNVVIIILIQIGKAEIIAQIDCSLVFFEVDKLDILIYFTHFRSMRFHSPVRINNAIDTEISV